MYVCKKCTKNKIYEKIKCEYWVWSSIEIVVVVVEVLNTQHEPCTSSTNLWVNIIQPNIRSTATTTTTTATTSSSYHTRTFWANQQTKANKRSDRKSDGHKLSNAWTYNQTNTLNNIEKAGRHVSNTEPHSLYVRSTVSQWKIFCSKAWNYFVVL